MLNKKQARIKNQDIPYETIQLKNQDTGALETVLKSEALRHAAVLQGDLVLVNEKLNPPLCTIVIRKHEVAPLDKSEFPWPLKRVVEEYEAEAHLFSRVHRLIDSIEVLVKLHTVLIISAYFESEDIDDTLKALLCRGLRTPSLGIWWEFAREFGKNIKNERQNYVSRDFLAYISPKGELFKCMEGKNNFINFRNKYAHGATPNQEECQKELEAFSPRFGKCLAKAGHLRDYTLWFTNSGQLLEYGSYQISADGDDVNTKSVLREGHSYSSSSAGLIHLHPLLLFDSESKRSYFYNDLRDDGAAVLNYDECHHRKEAALRDALLDKYPIHEWKENAGDQFKDLIELLTETFKGRKQELGQMVRFLSNPEFNRGFMLIWGSPGVGKSALMARLSQVLNWPQAIKKQSEIKGLEASIDSANLIIIEYFIRRSRTTNTAAEFYRIMLGRLENQFKTGIRPSENTLKGQHIVFKEMLRAISSKLQSSQRLVLIIDGLDEGVEDEDLLNALPLEVPEKILVLYSSRNNPIVREKIYSKLMREYRQDMDLTGLSRGDIRSILYEYINKYQLRDEYVETLVQKSAGNPLYIKLICRGLQNGDYTLADINLPSRLSEIYSDILQNLYNAAGKNGKTKSAAELLKLMAACHDYIPEQMAADLLDCNLDEIKHYYVYQTRDLLHEDPFSEGNNNYQIFHESLQEYLKQNCHTEIQDYREKLVKWCAKWQDLEGASKEYALRYQIAHILELSIDISERLKLITTLLDNEDYRDSIFYYCGNFEPLREAYRSILTLSFSPQTVGKNSHKILDYTFKQHTEPLRMYEKQLTQITETAQKGSLEPLAHLSAMGQTDTDKFMLIIKGLWDAKPGTKITKNVEWESKKLCKELNSPVLDRLWEESVKRITGSGFNDIEKREGKNGN